jgi:hypothetical protein
MAEGDTAAWASSEAEQRISVGSRDSGAYFYKSMSNFVDSWTLYLFVSKVFKTPPPHMTSNSVSLRVFPGLAASSLLPFLSVPTRLLPFRQLRELKNNSRWSLNSECNRHKASEIHVWISIALRSLYYVLVRGEERQWVEFDAEVLETTNWFVSEGCEDSFWEGCGDMEMYGAWCVNKGNLPRQMIMPNMPTDPVRWRRWRIGRRGAGQAGVAIVWYLNTFLGGQVGEEGRSVQGNGHEFSFPDWVWEVKLWEFLIG